AVSGRSGRARPSGGQRALRARPDFPSSPAGSDAARRERFRHGLCCAKCPPQVSCQLSVVSCQSNAQVRLRVSLITDENRELQSVSYQPSVKSVLSTTLKRPFGFG